MKARRSFLSPATDMDPVLPVPATEAHPAHLPLPHTGLLSKTLSPNRVLAPSTADPSNLLQPLPSLKPQAPNTVNHRQTRDSKPLLPAPSTDNRRATRDTKPRLPAAHTLKLLHPPSQVTKGPTVPLLLPHHESPSPLTMLHPPAAETEVATSPQPHHPTTEPRAGTTEDSEAGSTTKAEAHSRDSTERSKVGLPHIRPKYIFLMQLRSSAKTQKDKIKHLKHGSIL
jgi:hypothetical protein